MAALRRKPNTLWMGWADTGSRCLTAPERTALEEQLAQQGCAPVYLEEGSAELYYEGFSNSALWPLFHGFPQHARFQQSAWKAYVQVNRRFCQAVLREARAEDVVWVQDYHLMLLPAMLRRERPDLRIGFFLHVPFPDFETFRMLPWREELLRGVLGANLVGFHADDYAHHFLSCCQRLLQKEHRNGRLSVGGRTVDAGAFPLGIDYEHLRRAAGSPSTTARVQELRSQPAHAGCKIMLSVERLDYSKGVPERLHAFDSFLQRHPEWRERVVLVVVTVPSREGVESYQLLKTQIDELVGSINGKHATLRWSPVEYYYRSLPFETLVALYAASDVMLVTPLRDGMNLVCKEYLACHAEQPGVLVLSEMAGAACELRETLQVNPYDEEGLVSTMERALTMPHDERRQRNESLQRHIACYTSEKWAEEFLGKLTADDEPAQQRSARTRQLGSRDLRQLASEFSRARKRAILLDYDGTLVPLAATPEQAAPDAELLSLLRMLANDQRTLLAVISGRDRGTLEQWINPTGAHLAAEHGAWLKPGGPSQQSQQGEANRPPSAEDGAWHALGSPSVTWKDEVRAVLGEFADRTPGSLLEEKDFSLAWHYRLCNPDLGERRASEAKEALAERVQAHDLALLEGHKVIEVRPKGVSKGIAARLLLGSEPCDFILAAGDDATDEDLFQALPKHAWTIKVGEAANATPTAARRTLKTPADVRALLQTLASKA